MSRWLIHKGLRRVVMSIRNSYEKPAGFASYMIALAIVVVIVAVAVWIVKTFL